VSCPLPPVFFSSRKKTWRSSGLTGAPRTSRSFFFFFFTVVVVVVDGGCVLRLEQAAEGDAGRVVEAVEDGGEVERELRGGDLVHVNVGDVEFLAQAAHDRREPLVVVEAPGVRDGLGGRDDADVRHVLDVVAAREDAALDEHAAGAAALFFFFPPLLLLETRSRFFFRVSFLRVTTAPSG